MNLLRTVIPVLLCLGHAAGQYLETFIPLPDSIGAIRSPYNLAWDSAGDNIYIGGQGGMVLVDADSLLRVARILDGDTVNDVCSAERLNKVYCACQARRAVLAIDCETDSVVAEVPVGSVPGRLSYNSVSQKVYCIGDDSAVAVIDARADTVAAVVRVGGFPRYTPCFDPVDNKVYVATRRDLLVIDGTSDSVVKRFGEALGSDLLHYYAGANKVYAATRSFSVAVIDCALDSVVASLPIWSVTGFCSDPLANQVYCASSEGRGGELIVIDGAADTIVYRLAVPHYLEDLVCDATRNRVFLSCGEVSNPGSLAFVDIASRCIIRTVETVTDPGRVLADSRRDRVLCTDGPLEAVDMDTGAIIGITQLAVGAHEMVHDYLDDKVYYGGGGRYGGVGVVDGARNRTLPSLPPERDLQSVSWNPRNNRLYLAVQDDTTDLVVYDCAADTLVSRIDLEPFQTRHNEACLDTLRNKLFLSGHLDGAHALGVVDCAGESLLAALYLPGNIWGMWLADQHGKLYCWCSIPFDYLLVVVDCNTNSIIRISETPGNPYSACYSPEDAALYFATISAYHHLNVTRDSIVASIPGGVGVGYPTLQYVPGYRKLYWFLPRVLLGCDSVLVIDPKADSVMGRLTVRFGTSGTCLDHAGRFLYAVRSRYTIPDQQRGRLGDAESCSFSVGEGDSAVWVIDCATDSVVAVVDIEALWSESELVLNPNDRRVYVTRYGSTIPVIGCESPGGAEESGPPAETRRQPTIARAALMLGDEPATSGRHPVLLDVTGRRVMELAPGDNDVRCLAPGVYFVKDPGGSTLSKVVLAR